MIVINLFGGPGSGKSTTAAGIFFKLKLMGVNCELVTEYAKDMVWREMSQSAFEDQLYITAKQNHRLERLRNKVDIAITDSPLLLSLIYSEENYLEGKFKDMVSSLWNKYENYNFFIVRRKKYNPIGRNQTEKESDKISLDIRNNFGYLIHKEVMGGEDAPEKIINYLKENGKV